MSYLSTAIRSFLALAAFSLTTTHTISAQPSGKAAQGRKKYVFAQKDSESPYVQNVTKNTEEDQEKDGSFTRIGYRSYTDMLTEIDALRGLHAWADTTYQRRLAALPPGGALLVTMRRQGAGRADLANLTIVATTKDGKEVFNQTLAPGGGRFFGRDLYQAQRTIPFPKTDPQVLTVSIRDAKLYQTFDYLLTLPAGQ